MHEQWVGCQSRILIQDLVRCCGRACAYLRCGGVTAGRREGLVPGNQHCASES